VVFALNGSLSIARRALQAGRLNQAGKILSTIALNRSRKKPARPGLSIPLPPLGEEEEQRYRPIDRVLLRRVLGLLVPFKKQYALGVTLGSIMA
jgi:hypothetical protein